MVSIPISMMSKTSPQLDIAVAVPMRPKPMVKGERIFGKGDGNCAGTDYISHHQLSRKWRCFRNNVTILYDFPY